MEPFISQVMIWANNFAPRSWSLCNGQLVSIAQNTALFSLIGTTFGGDGRTTFALPGMRGRVPVHPGRGAGLMPVLRGQTGGADSVTLNALELPSHNHSATPSLNVTIPASTAAGTTDNPSGNVYATTSVTIEGGGQATGNIYAATGAVAGPVAPSLTETVTIDPTGGGLAHENRQPYIAINYLIAMVGLFPSRS